MSASTLNCAYSALQLYFEKILCRKFFFSIPRAKKEKHLPSVLSKSEVMAMIGAIKNPKHNCIVSLLYGTGVRVSELTHIKMRDIDLDRLMLRVYQGKGKKDRLTVLPQSLKDILARQCKVKIPDDFLFTNGRGGWLTETTIQKIVAQYKKVWRQKGILPNFQIHWMNWWDWRLVWRKIFGFANQCAT